MKFLKPEYKRKKERTDPLIGKHTNQQLKMDKKRDVKNKCRRKQFSMEMFL